MKDDDYTWDEMSKVVSLSEHYSNEKQLLEKLDELDLKLKTLGDDEAEERDRCESYKRRIKSMLKRTTKVINSIRTKVDDSEIGAGEDSDTSGFRKLPAITDRNPDAE